MLKERFLWQFFLELVQSSRKQWLVWIVQLLQTLFGMWKYVNVIFTDAYRCVLARCWKGVSLINACKFHCANTDEQHSCQFSGDQIEDEKHLLLICPVHSQYCCKYLPHLSDQSAINLMKSKENNNIFNVSRLFCSSLSTWETHFLSDM